MCVQHRHGHRRPDRPGHDGRPAQCQSTGGRGPSPSVACGFQVLRDRDGVPGRWGASTVLGPHYGRLAPPSRDHRGGVGSVHGRPSADPEHVRRSATRARRADGDHRVNPRCHRHIAASIGDVLTRGWTRRITASEPSQRNGEMTDGAVVSLWRYPVKSMMGEELNASDLTDRGLLGDRSLALVDTETGKVISGKNPRKWATMFDFRAVFTTPPVLGSPLPPVRVTLPDGVSVTSDAARFAELLTSALGRPVTLAIAAPPEPSLGEYWPDIAALARQETVTEEAMPAGLFFDL